MDATAIDLMMRYALAVAAESGSSARGLGPVHLVKYAYLADLAQAESTGQTYSGAAWRFDHFGPYADAVAAASDEAEPWDPDEDERDLARLRARLPVTVRLSIEREVKAWGTDTAGLLDRVYRSAPMLRAAPGDLLVFEQRPASPPRAPEPALSTKQQKKMTEARNALRAKVQTLRARRAPERGRVREPRFDEVFAAGAAWLDALAGAPVDACRGALSIDDSVWSSETRRDHGD